MIITYKSRPYDTSYLAQLIEKEVGLVQGVDFTFGAHNAGETTVIYLRDMTKQELADVQELFDTPIANDTAIKNDILSNILKIQTQGQKKSGTVTAINGSDYTVRVTMTDEFTNPEVKDGSVEHNEICKSIVEGVKVGDTVYVENIEDKIIIMGKLQ